MNDEINSAEVTVYDKIRFGTRVRAKRTSLQKSQEWLAEELGTSVETVKNIENAKRGTSIEKLILLAKALETTPDFLLGYGETNDIQSGPTSENFKTLVDYLKHCSPEEIEAVDQFAVLLVNTLRNKK